MSTTTYVFVEKYERYQHFSDEKNALSVAMINGQGLSDLGQNIVAEYQVTIVVFGEVALFE